MSDHDPQTPKDSSVSVDDHRESANPSPATERPDEGSAPSREAAPPDDSGAADLGRREAGAEDATTVEGDLDELVKIAAQRDEYLALAQRTQADFENYRKRMAKDAKLSEIRGAIRLAKELLPALDNLSRALESAATDDPLLEGVRLVHADIVGALSRAGIESFSPAGEPFDPNEHEAMAQQPVEGATPGTVVEVYQAGYRANGTIIRPARVVVAA